MGLDPLDAPGLPSRVGLLLGMPFGLATPGGQPVAVCFRLPLLSCVSFLRMSASSTILAVVSRQDTSKCPGPRSPGISHFLGVANPRGAVRSHSQSTAGGAALLQAERAARPLLGTLRNLNTDPRVSAGQRPIRHGQNGPWRRPPLAKYPAKTPDREIGDGGLRGTVRGERL